MGWLEYNIYNSPKKECDKILTWEAGTRSCNVVKSYMKGNVYYAVINVKNTATDFDKNTAVVFLTHYSPKAKNFNFAYKDMDEDMHPFYYDFPESYLELLSETTNPSAIKWREECHKRNSIKKRLSKLKKGDIIEFQCPLNTSITNEGQTIRVYKHSKNCFIYSSYRWPIQWIPGDFVVVSPQK